MMMRLFLKKTGFTRSELLVVAGILISLALVSFANFQTSEIKARDVQRKHDLRQIANALSAYSKNHGRYPAADEQGRLIACGCYDPLLPCDWTRDEGQREFCDEKNLVYMPKIPGDPKGKPAYCYASNGLSYQLYAKLEARRDPEAKGPFSCAGFNAYNFSITSQDVKGASQE